MLKYFAKKVRNTSEAIYNIVAVPDASQQLAIKPLSEVIVNDEYGQYVYPQASAYPGPLSYGNYQYSGTQAAGGKFDDDLDCYEPLTVIDHSAARAQVRKLEVQSVECVKVLNRNASYTVGKGLYVKSTPNAEITGMTPEQARDWGKRATTLFHLWAKSKDSDIEGDNTFYQNQRFAQRQKKRDGEAFPRYLYSKNPELVNPLQVGFFDANQIRGDEITFSSGPESQDVGFIFDENGKTTGYKVWVVDQQKPGHFKDKIVQAKDKSTGLPLMGHIFEKKTAGQKRGITPLLPAISDLEKITGYKTATFDKMQTSATYTFWIGNDEQTPSNMDLSSMNAQSAGTEFTVEGCSTEVPVAAAWKYNTMGGSYSNGQRATSVLIDGGQKGDKLNSVPASEPGETSGEFVKYNSNSIAASCNMSHEIVDMEFTTSFTSAKGALGLQDIEAGVERDDIDSDFINDAFFAVTSGFIASGKLSAPGWSDPVIRAGYLEKRLTHDPPIILRPGEESVATLNNILMNRETFEDAAERLNNSSFERNALSNREGFKLLNTQLGTPIIDQDSEDEKEDNQDTEE